MANPLIETLHKGGCYVADVFTALQREVEVPPLFHEWIQQQARRITQSELITRVFPAESWHVLVGENLLDLGSMGEIGLEILEVLVRFFFRVDEEHDENTLYDGVIEDLILEILQRQTLTPTKDSPAWKRILEQAELLTIAGSIAVPTALRRVKVDEER